MIDITTTFAVISWKKEAYRIMIADKIKNARTILYYITNAQCSFGGRQCDYSGSGSISASKRNDAARADDFKGKEVYQSGH